MSNMPLAVPKGYAGIGLGARQRPRAWRNALRLARAQPLGVVGLVLILLVFLTSVFASQIARSGPLDIGSMPLSRPSSEHWFGTDDFGRDIFSRVLHGGRVSLVVGFFAVLLGCAIGTTIGLISAYDGG